MKQVLFLILCCTGLIRAGEWVLPWVAENEGVWSSELVLNYHGQGVANVSLTAVRADGTNQTVLKQLTADTQWTIQAATLFDVLGYGPGYSVFVEADVSELTAAVRVASLNTASGFSPSMGSAIPLASTGSDLVFPLLPADGFSAPVIVNLSQDPVVVTVAAYTDQGFYDDVTREIQGRRPLVGLISEFFPELDRSAWLRVSAKGVLAGANFSFNGLREPSLVNAEAGVIFGDEGLDPLMAALDTSALLAWSFHQGTASLFTNKQKKMDCPEISLELNAMNPFLVARLDWGSGCATAGGATRSGSIDLEMSREGGLQDAAWMSGQIAFNNFTTSYEGAETRVLGSAGIEASMLSPNFSLFADMQLDGDTPIWESAGSLALQTTLSGAIADGLMTLRGHVRAEVDVTYAWFVDATILSGDPLIFDYAVCPWPIDGSMQVQANYSGKTLSGTVDFGTGSCASATLTLAGVSREINLNEVFQP